LFANQSRKIIKFYLIKRYKVKIKKADDIRKERPRLDFKLDKPILRIKIWVAMK